MAASEDELNALMTRLAEGDRSVFSAVFTRLWTPILRLCVTLLRHDADASDAAQQAMQKIFERAAEYDPRRPALPWAMAIAAWECKTLQRKRGRRHEVAEQNAGDRPGSNAEEEFVHSNLIHAALTAFGELSTTDRETLVATFSNEAAAVSGATLRKRRERAIDRLRHTFKRLYGLE